MTMSQLDCSQGHTSHDTIQNQQLLNICNQQTTHNKKSLPEKHEYSYTDENNANDSLTAGCSPLYNAQLIMSNSTIEYANIHSLSNKLNVSGSRLQVTQLHQNISIILCITQITLRFYVCRQLASKGYH